MNRDEYGAIILDNINYSLLDSKHTKIVYNDTTYYLKRCIYIDRLYNELVAEFIARDYGIPCTYSDIYIRDGFYGYMSEDIGNKYNTMSYIINDNNNNLNDIWNILNTKYSKIDTLKMMCDIVDLFLYDVLIGNFDRNNLNYSFYGSGLGMLYDNENMLSEYSIYDGFYSLQVDDIDYNMDIGEYNLLDKFLSQSDSLYLDILKSKLWIIGFDNLNNIFERIEKRLGVSMQKTIKNRIINDMKTNYCMIKKVIKKYDKD